VNTPLKQSIQRRAHSRREFCARWGISTFKLEDEIKSGRLRAIKLGKKVLIPVEAEEAWAAALPSANAVGAQ
jgi:excisionase family DNA binding protein